MPSTEKSPSGGPRGGGGGGGGGDRRGGGSAIRGARPPRPSKFEEHDVVNSRPQALPSRKPGGEPDNALPSKKGSSGLEVALKANYFKLHSGAKWSLFHYRVDFKPELDRTSEKKELFSVHNQIIGSNIFDGHSLYVAHKLQPNPMILYSQRRMEKVQVVIRLVDTLEPSDPMYLNFYNIIVRKCLSLMKLEEVGRHFYDDKAAIEIPQHQLELWPGYITSMRNHESDVLLCVEVTHKIIRKETVLNIIHAIRRRNDGNSERIIKGELLKFIVMTKYNKRTYRIDDVKFDLTPMSTFDQKGKKVTYMDYYKSRYQFDILDKDQPLLVSLPKKKDIHRGVTGPIFLIPELCHMTGLTENQRKDVNLNRDLSSHFHMEPCKRQMNVSNFMTRLNTTKGVVKELEQWDVKFDPNLVELNGRTLPQEEIVWSNNAKSKSSSVSGGATQAFPEWSKNLKTSHMLRCVDLKKWGLIYMADDNSRVADFLKKLDAMGRSMGFVFQPPMMRKITRPPGSNMVAPQSFVKAIDEIMEVQQQRAQMIFIILPTNKIDFYGAVKKRCFLDYGVLSQCFLSKNVSKPLEKLEAIIMKLVVQINTKLGGEPWTVAIPPRAVMIMGFDVYHSGGGGGSASVGALVASTNQACTSYYSCVSFHKSKNELSSNLCTDVAKALNAYKDVNRGLPEKIIMYRDGVGEGQLTYVYNTELKQIKMAVDSVYKKLEKPIPRFCFIIVTKGIHTRFFTSPLSKNPNPGTVVDDVVTLPERYDFYIVSQRARQGTVSPTAYNVLYDTLGLKPDLIQILTFKLCHLYFNWSGTVAVPSVVQYAHKLAFLTGTAIGAPANRNLSHLLYFL